MLAQARSAFPLHVLRHASACLLMLATTFAAAQVERTGGPYVPTPQAVVDAMLELAKVGPGDLVVDLGSGDGRIVLTAAQRYSARGVGVDIDPELVQQSNAEAKRRGLSDRVSFKEQDVLQASIEEATVLTLYLLPGMMQTLQTKLLRELKPGTRIVAHDFSFGDWKPDREVTIDIPEKYGTVGKWKSTLFYWVVPAQLEGAWQITMRGAVSQPIAVTFAQQFQVLDGTAAVRDKRIAITEGRLDANRVRFKLMLAGVPYELRGVVEANRMSGEATHAGRALDWSGIRVPR
jgi:SAM-dependent methyltransferase